MSFKSRRQPLCQKILAQNLSSSTIRSTLSPGVRPSPLDGRPTTSTGTRSLDSLLAGHVGLSLGNMLLIGEMGTTDFSGCLLKYYAAEGAVQGHKVHVFGLNEVWATELPGIAAETKVSENKSDPESSDRMKIAWRYERLGEFGAEASERTVVPQGTLSASVFCHDFDLRRRLSLSFYANLKFVPASSIKEPKILNSPFSVFLSHLSLQLQNSPSDTIHRIVVPSLLSPLFYPSEFCNPSNILQFFHSLRALLRKYKNQVTAMITLPLSLYPRDTGLTRWMELLSDGVLELSPLSSMARVSLSIGIGKSTQDEAPQGIFKIHKLPIFHEKGGGGIVGGSGDNLAFTLSRRKGLVIKPFSLPPIDGDLVTNSKASEGGDRGKSLEGDLRF